VVVKTKRIIATNSKEEMMTRPAWSKSSSSLNRSCFIVRGVDDSRVVLRVGGEDRCEHCPGESARGFTEKLGSPAGMTPDLDEALTQNRGV